ncbi:YcxB family protein [Roseovarius atlanticus]|uniref:YcxB family protein n=1 Tax=Roseovarius atlanticus TaxID=1641875 RepID=UPI001C938CE2|nr:YcxB family protein [Roseovarius atlanticus]MBY5987356.1 hypothetical protein [Roseovarius atlanticus]MBY6125996.1 hypothetical protein [Roseovarius atlanticus]MBY6149544.1 hypothetical protein [Roseovarius atlanticus]
MSYQFQSNAPLGVELFIKASHRQPVMNALHRAYLPMQAFILGLMIFVIAGCIAIGLLLIAWLDVDGMIGTLLLTLLPFAVAALIWFGFMRSIARGMYRRMLDSPLYNGPVRYDVSQKGFAMTSDTAHWSVDWPAMDKVTRHPSGLFMYAGGFIYAIPKEAAPADQYDAMWDDIRHWFEASQ